MDRHSGTFFFDMIKIIGIDPGLAETGIGIATGMGMKVENYSFGCIRTPKQDPLPDRLNKIFTEISHVLENESPDLMVVEDIFSLKQYPKSGITLGKVTGVLLLAGCRSKISVREIPVREAKQVLTGNGNAGKSQLEKAVRGILNMETPIRPYHASDAMALALIGLFRFGGGMAARPRMVSRRNKVRFA